MSGDPQSVQITANEPVETDQLLSDSKQGADEGTSSIPVAILNLVKMFLGAAMLSISWSFNQSSLIPGIILFLCATTYSFTTAMFIIESCEMTGVYEFSALLRRVHPLWEKLGAITLVYVCLSSLLSYIILIGDFITDGIRGIDPQLQFNFDRQIYIAFICVVILLPLSLQKEFKSLKARCLTVSLCVAWDSFSFPFCSLSI